MNNNPFLLNILMSIFSLFLISACNNSSNYENENNGTKEKSPQELGRRVVENLLSRPDLMMYVTDFWTGVHYAEACAGFGAARYAGFINDSGMLNRLSLRYSKVIEDSLVKNAHHVDANVYGILPLELYMQGMEEKFLIQGLQLADSQWENPLPNGLTRQTRFWIDDVWMIGSLQVQAYRATGEMIYLERAALEINEYLQKLQQPNGLFHHGENAPFFWGRGNGWVAAGLAELLTELPEANAHFNSILNGYNKMMDALAIYQADDGMWRQLIDNEESWKETSSTAMFGYAISVGVRLKILSEVKFIPVFQKAWNALTEYVDEEGNLSNICIGTGKSNDINYYLNRPRSTGDLHGQAPLLWFACSLLAEY